jgi:chromosomal replication initiation ATPase DnaA
MTKNKMIQNVVSELQKKEDISEVIILGFINEYKSFYEMENEYGEALFTRMDFEDRVKRVLGLQGVDLSEKNREPDRVLARAIMYLYYRSKGLTLTKIGDKYNCCHATVLHGMQMVKNLHEIKDKILINLLSDDETILDGLV